MTNYTLWADRGTGAEKIYEIAKYLKKCAGGSVNVLGIGPSVGQNYGLHNGKGTVAVYMTNGVGLATPNDLELGCKPGGYYQYDRAIFVWSEKIANNQYMSDTNILNHKVPGEWDWNRSASYNIGGQTAAKWFSSANYVDLVAANTPQEIAERICNGTYVTSSGNPSSPDSGGTGQTTSNSTSTDTSGTSPLLNGEMTFQELVGEICNGIDLLFLCKRSTVVVTDFETIFAEAKYLRDNNSSVVKSEQVNLWQMEEDSYELNINQHGFYNTVYVEYDKGVVKESFSDLVTVYGEVAIRYKDKGIDKTTAIMKAKAYLAAHLRDLEMTVNTTMLADADIDIGDIITVENPLTMANSIKTSQGYDPEFLFTKGVNTSWEGDSYISADIECQFSPTSPKKLEVPTAGTIGSSSSTSNNTSSGSFNQYGVSSDGTQIKAIGRPSAGGEGKYGYDFYESVFKRECPFCGSTELYWGIYWTGNETTSCGVFPGTGRYDCGSIEGHIFCKQCDADFSCILGADHETPPRAYLTRISGPTKCTKADAYTLKQGVSA